MIRSLLCGGGEHNLFSITTVDAFIKSLQRSVVVHGKGKAGNGKIPLKGQLIPCGGTGHFVDGIVSPPEDPLEG